ncbi:MAG: hypothetical protein KGL53_05015, partial [Elusimicrobia bacterium]|nr:hypothetical protein [Elusimicrobiota bacterium]
MMPLAALLLFLAAPARAGALDAPDAAFAQGLYQQALSGYEAALSSGPAADRPKALWRACESEGLLLRTGSAYERLRGASLPDDPLWRARFALLRAELAREELAQSRFTRAGDVVEGAADAFRLTPAQLRSAAQEGYAEAWASRRLLSRRSVADEAYFLDVDASDRARWPTLLDFLVERWTDFLLSDAETPAGAAKPAPESFLAEDYAVAVDSALPSAALAGALYEEASRLGGTGREAAREAWRVRRLALPFDAEDRTAPWADETASLRAASDRLLAWRAAFTTPVGRSEAGFEAAALLDRAGRRE